MLHPLFSAAPTQALSAAITTNAILLACAAALLTSKYARWLSWRTLWLLIAGWEIASDSLIAVLGERLMRLGLDSGVVVGRLLLEAVPTLATWIWLANSTNCKERSRILPAWFLPLAFLGCQICPLRLPRIKCFPECYILQTHGVLLSTIALLSPSPEPRKVPRSAQHPQPPRTLAHSSPFARLASLGAILALAHFVARFSTHCLTSPSPTTETGLEASRRSVTGWISVGEYDLPSQQGNLTMRYLRADHSLLGGLWIGPSRAELAAASIPHHAVEEEEVVRRAESIYSTFILQELVRLVVRPPDLPTKAPEQGLIIGLGAGLSARALYQHSINLTIVEIDEAVYDLARAYFGVADVPAGEVVLEDAVTWAARTEPNGRYDYIVHDVFTGGAVPAGLFAEPFLQDLYRLLHPSGVVAVNFAGDLSSVSSLRILTTLHRVFPRCRAFSDGPAADTGTSDKTFRNMVMLCTKEWLVDLELREPTVDDYLAFPSPRVREQVFSTFRSREVDLSAFRRKAASTEGDKWVIKDKRDVRRVEREQLDEVGVHWKVMQTVLPLHVWARW
ncbi:hypothetical protein JCM10908_007291 [Rhodotorula pacifica]|uniref:spermidine synthase n=1 Tax=Rhodotorula pacifica TaxID=1495444 RepID=UPI003179B26C